MRRGTFFLTIFFLLLLSCQAEFPDPYARRRGPLSLEPTKPVNIVAAPVKTHEVPFIFRQSGITEPADRLVVKAPEGGGVVEQIFVEEGQRVEPGDPLIKFQEEELKLKLEAARTQVEEAELGLGEARSGGNEQEKKTEEAETPLPEGGENPSQSPQDKAKLYEATLKRGRSEIELFEKQIDLLQIDNTIISGIVTERKVSNGQKVGSNEELLTIVRAEPVYFTFEAPLDVASTLEKGGTVAVTFSDFEGREFLGEILSIGLETAAQGGVAVKLFFSNETLALKAGMNGTVVINTPLTRKVITVPKTALIQTRRSTYVYKVEAGKLDRVSITLEEKEVRGEPVVEKGLEAGDVIAISNVEDLKEGMLVAIENDKTL